MKSLVKTRFPRTTLARKLAITSNVSLAVAVLVGTSFMSTQTAFALDPTAIDSKTDPRVDFARYANGIWLDKTNIPADQPIYGTFNEVGDALDQKLAAIVATPQSSPDGQKLVALYNQALDMTTRNTAGFKPIESDLNRIRTAKTLRQLSSGEGGTGQLATAVFPSPTNPTIYALTIGGPTLGLGSRDAYLSADPAAKGLHQRYIAFLAAQLQLVGYAAPIARKEAKRVFALEKSIATLLLDQREVAANIQLANNPIPLSQLQKLTPSIDWRKLASASSLGAADTVIVTEPNYLKKYESLYKRTPLSTVKALTVSQLLGSAGGFLSDDIGNLQFEFFGKVLSGQEQRTPIERRSLNQASGLMSDAIGKLYVEQSFSEAAKTEIVTMTKEVLAAFRARIEANTWMSPTTKAKAVEKLDKVKVRVAYPDQFLNYDDVKIGATYAETVSNILSVSGTRELAKVGKPVDQTNWGPVAIVNAFYDPSNNTINFPAGILAGAFFDVKNDPAANFGAIGAVIGHELTHGFDISGSQFDGDGRLASWWTEQDQQQFQALNGKLATQYGTLKIENVGNVDGRLTVGENVADLGGVQVAYDAFNARLAKLAAAGTPDPGLIDGLTQKQRFFVAWTQQWKSKARPEFAKFLLAQDVHSPDSIRATQPIKNMNAFYEAFGIKEGDPMWLAPAERIVVW